MKNKFILVTDSTTDLPYDLANELGLVIMPLKYQIADKEFNNYLDYREQPIKEFYDLVQAGNLATTSQLIPDDYIDLLTPYLNDNTDVIILSFSSKLSGTYNSARLATEDLKEKYPNNKIHLIDSKSASLGEGMVAYLGAKYMNKGNSIEDTVSYIEKTIPTIAHWFTVNDISHLRRGGRISAVSSVVAKALSIKPIMHCNDDGELIPRNKAISRKKSINELFNKMKKSAVEKQEVVFIGHGDDLEAANHLKNLVLEKYPNVNIIINNIGPVIGSHTGQGVLALFFVANNR